MFISIKQIISLNLNSIPATIREREAFVFPISPCFIEPDSIFFLFFCILRLSRFSCDFNRPGSRVGGFYYHHVKPAAAQNLPALLPALETYKVSFCCFCSCDFEVKHKVFFSFVFPVTNKHSASYNAPLREVFSSLFVYTPPRKTLNFVWWPQKRRIFSAQLVFEIQSLTAAELAFD